MSRTFPHLNPLLLSTMTKVAASSSAGARARQETMARAKLAPKQAVVKHTVPDFAAHSVLTETLECPLCIEPLDATDRDFWPCLCGYQVCLFCYQRLQNEYNNTCPGCRQQYSDDLEEVRKHIARKQQQQQAEVAAAAARAAVGSSHHTTGHHHGHHAGHHAAHHTAHHGHAALAGHAAASRAKPGAAAATAKQRLSHEAPNHSRTGSQGSSDGPAASSSLPPTANWVSAAVTTSTAVAASNSAEPPQQQQQQHQQQQQQELPAPPAGDDSAWPTLGAAQQQQQHRADSGHGHERRRSSSSSLTAVHLQQHQHHQSGTPSSRHDASRSSFESTASTVQTSHTERQQQQQQQPQQPEAQQTTDDQQATALQEQQEPEHEEELERGSSGFTTVEVTTVVSGARHSVCVPVSNHQEVKAFPEAATLLDMLQQAVTKSKLSSTEAAVQLVQCLRKLEADSSSSKQGNWLQKALANGRNGTHQAAARLPTATTAARAPPPGFGHAATARQAAASAVNGTTAQQQQQVPSSAQQHQNELPGPGWGLYRGQQQQQGETPQSSMHSVDSNSSLFSQGSSLSQSVWTDSGLPGVDLGVTRLAGGLGSGLPAAVPARLQMLWAGNTTSSINGTQGGDFSSSGLGYGSSTAAGPPPGFAGTSAAAGLGLGSRLNGAYNPLSFANLAATAGPAQQATNGSLPPGFGANLSGDASLKQQQQQPAFYRPFA